VNSFSINKQRIVLLSWLLFVAALGLLSSAKLITWLLVLPGLGLLLTKRATLALDPGWRQFWFWLGICWLLPAVLAMPDALNPERAWHQWLRLLSYGLAATVFFVLPLASQYHQRFLTLSAVIVLLLALDGLAQYALGSNSIGLPLFADGRYPAQITGFLGVDYGWVMAVLSPLVWFGLAETAMGRKTLWLAMPLLLGVVLLSGSRAAFILALLAMLLVSLQLYSQGERRAAVQFLFPAAAALALALLMMVSLPDLHARWQDLLLVFGGTEQGSLKALSLRPLLWSQGLSVFQEHWVNGVGLRGFAELAHHDLLPPKPQGWSTHLALLDVATDTGLIGLIAYLGFYLGLLGWWWRARGESSAFGMVALLAFAPIGSTLPLYSARLGNMGWMCLAIALALAMSHRRGEQ